MPELHGKYIISKANGEPVDPNSDYFVLRLDSDPIARIAAFVYAKEIWLENPALAEDLIARLKCYEIIESPDFFLETAQADQLSRREAMQSVFNAKREALWARYNSNNFAN